MSVGSLGVSRLWQDLSKAIEQKSENPEQFERAYIGNIESPAHKPIHGRRLAKRSAFTARVETFALGEPFSGVSLTRRETQVLYLICRGSTNHAVAARMELSVRTAEYYIKNMRKKLLAKSKSHLIKQVIQTDFLERVNDAILLEPV